MKAKIQHEIQEYCSLLRLSAISDNFEEVAKTATDYGEFLHQLLRMEVDAEEQRAKQRKIKAAKFPYPNISKILKQICFRKGCVSVCRNYVHSILFERVKTSL